MKFSTFCLISILLLLNSSNLFSQCLNNGVDSNKCYAKVPFPPVNFSIAKEFESVEGTAVYTSPLVIDTDGDCIPEIIMSANNNTTINPNPRTTKDIRIVNSSNGQTISTITTAYFSWHAGNSYAVADIDLDGTVEIILAAADITANAVNERGRLICYNINGTIKWISNQPFGVNTLYGYGGSVGLCDFNRDGIAECYIYNEIFNATTGIKLADGGANGKGLSRDVSLPEGSLAVGIAGQFKPNTFNLELACGYSVYEISITNTNGTIGNSMTPINITIDGGLKDGYTSMADINLDGVLDIIVTTRGDQNNAQLYVYDVTSGTAQLIAKTYLPSGGAALHAGTAFIGDIDGSGSPSICLARPYKLLAYQYNGTTNLVQLWDLTTNDESGETGLTMFDFNQDAIQEIVYRDMGLLRIINASTGVPNVLSSFACTSGTGIERPIIVDLHGNGESQICVTCGPYNAGKVEVFSSPVGQQPWAPSRSIWNQYSYHVFNINNNLTIPSNPINNATYGNGKSNNFFVQMTLIDSTGAFLQNASDAIVNIDCIDYDTLSNSIVVNYSISNSTTASNELQSGSIISIFNNSTATGTPLNQFNLQNAIQPGQLTSYSNYFTLNSVNLSQGITVKIDPVGLECDSINDLDSKTISLILSTIDTTICSNQPLFVNGNQVFTSGTYFNEYTTINGCDSLIEIYNVTVNPIVQNSISLIDCDSSIVNNQTFYTSGQYNQLLVNQYGCDSLLEINLTINNSNFISEKITVCDTFVWNNLTITSSGIYNYTFQNQYGCDSIRQIDLYFVPPYDLPISNFTINPTIVTYPNGEIFLSNLSENAVNYYWFFSDNNLTSSNFELSHQYNQVGDFYIQLITENEDGCRDTTIQEITIYDDLILYVPNTFTPDGNECNNVFTPVFSAPNLVDKYNLSIYNRWGELIFESHDKNVGWDGFYNLELCKSDVYTWKIIYSSFFTNDKKSLNGHFNLLK